MYYAAKNTHASDTSIGFANTWYVIGFATRAQRDAHVTAATDLATKAILSTELRAYHERRGQISYYTADGVFMEYTGNGFAAASSNYWDSVYPSVCRCW